ncbi:MAG: D-glycero-beta-D-manno-heptose 1,7-bisphosphate 7-phosphatase [Veillonellales bacterium]
MTNLKPAVFFDRDGVLNIDHGYVYRSEDFEWMPGAIAAIKHFNDQGCLVFVITNQSGIARGYYTEQDFQKLNEFMERELAKHNARIDAFYYCPHHKDGIIPQYTKDCTCRKPQPGMLLKAMEEWPVDKDQSILIGDKPSDMEAAQAAGIPGYLYQGSNLYDFVLKIF